MIFFSYQCERQQSDQIGHCCHYCYIDINIPIHLSFLLYRADQAAPPAITKVKRMILNPDEMVFNTGIRVNTKLAVMESRTTARRTLFSLAGGTMIARNIP